MHVSGFDVLADETERTETRFVTFITPAMNRYDLAVTATGRFFGKKLVTDLQRGRTAPIGPDDAREEGALEAAFGWSTAEADELRDFLAHITGETETAGR